MMIRNAEYHGLLQQSQWIIRNFNFISIFFPFQIMALYSKTVKYLRQVTSAPEKKKQFEVQQFE